jgi:Na+(H+)/acetate symporter ActP
MPAFITTALAFLTASWPTLLALGALTTAINQVVQRLPDRFARFKNVVNTITVDYVNLLAEIGGALKLGPRVKPSDLQ